MNEHFENTAEDDYARQDETSAGWATKFASRLLIDLWPEQSRNSVRVFVFCSSRSYKNDAS